MIEPNDLETQNLFDESSESPYNSEESIPQFEIYTKSRHNTCQNRCMIKGIACFGKIYQYLTCFTNSSKQIKIGEMGLLISNGVFKGILSPGLHIINPTYQKIIVKSIKIEVNFSIFLTPFRPLNSPRSW